MLIIYHNKLRYPSNLRQVLDSKMFRAPPLQIVGSQVESDSSGACATCQWIGGNHWVLPLKEEV
jgi:hypothetical protein